MTIQSNIDICNLALSHLGISSINDIEEPITSVEIICNQFEVINLNIINPTNIRQLALNIANQLSLSLSWNSESQKF